MKNIKFEVNGYKLEVKIKDDITKDLLDYLKNQITKELKQFHMITDLNDPESELYKFNTSILDFRGSRDFFDYLTDTIYWFGITDGIFNPFIITIDKDILNIKNGNWGNDSRFKLNKITYDFPEHIHEMTQYIDIDYTNQRVKFIRPVKLDFSGISKGIFVDKSCKILCKELKNYVISFGGDNFYKTGEGDEPWTFTIDNPITGEKSEINLEAENRAISLSGTVSLDSQIENVSQHIILDPRLQAPSNNNLALVIIKAENCKTSDVLAKTFLIGTEEDRTNLGKKFKNIKRIEIDKVGKITVF